MTVASTAVPVRVPQERARPRSGRRTVALAGVYYLLAALAVTLWLWRDPASRTVAGNPNDADQFAWFFRYDATAIAHFRLPDAGHHGHERAAGREPHVEHAACCCPGSCSRR